MKDAAGEPDRRMRLAIVSNALHPYREHLHRRIVNELPVDLINYITHARGDFAWRERSPHPAITRVWLDENDARTSSARRRPLTEYRKAQRVIAALEATAPHAVIVEGYGDAGRLHLIRHLAKLGAPLFLRADSNVRGDTAQWPRSWVKRIVVRWVVRRADGIMPVGNLGVEYFVRYGADRNRCYVVPYEPDYEFWASTPDTGSVSLPDNVPILAFSGRLVHEKGVDLLLEALARPFVSALGWHLVIAGDGPERTALSNLARQWLPQRVTLAGFCDEATLREIYHRSDTLILPSRAEPWGNVVTEAMAAGARVLASDVVGSASDLVDRPSVGTIFRSESVASLADAITTHLAAPLTPSGRDVVRSRLAEWRALHDPVRGIEQALTEAGLPLPSSPP